MKYLEKVSPSAVFESIRKGLDEALKAELEERRNEINEANFRRVNRIRNGQVQRRKMIGTNGYRVHGDNVVRMTPQERRKRHRGQIRGARKRRATMARADRRRTISLRKRSRFGEGLHEDNSKMLSDILQAAKNNIPQQAYSDLTDIFNDDNGTSVDIASDDFDGADDVFTALMQNLKGMGYNVDYATDDSDDMLTHMLMIDGPDDSSEPEGV